MFPLSLLYTTSKENKKIEWQATSDCAIIRLMGFSLFPALFDRPGRVRFAYQEEDEYIELLLRQHWVTNIPWILFTLAAFLVPLLISPLILLMGLDLGIEMPTDVTLATTVLWYLLIFAYAIEKFINWYFNIFIVTNLHIVDVDFHNLLNRHTTEIRLGDIQSPRAQIRGILGSLFNFGDVHIETAAKTQHIEFLSIPKPDLVVDRVQDLQEGKV